jgi:biotin carboxylase
VLYVGWQREPVEALQVLGAAVTCVVPPGVRHKPAEEGFRGPVAVAADHTDVEAVLGALADEARTPADFWTVCTEDEFALVAAAVLGSLGAARPASVATALALRDKAVQKAAIRKAGLPVADWARRPSLAAVRELRWPTPYVVKPTAGAGSQHTHVVRDPEVDLAAAELEPGAPEGPWLAETYVPGEELHADGVVRDGRPLVVSVSRYLHNVVDVHHGRLVASATLDSAAVTLEAATRDLVGEALAALGHTDGVFHLEAFHDRGRLTFGECAGRIGGGMIVEAVRARHDVDLYAEWAAAALHLPSPGAGRARPEAPGSLGWANLPAPPGLLRAMPAKDLIERQEQVIEAQVWAKPGDTVGDQRLGSHLLVAKVLVGAATEAEARSRLDAVARWFAGELDVVEESPA